jgi:hypothetical protein
MCHDMKDCNIVDSIMLCASVLGGGKDFSQGDPLRWGGTQTGEVAWGNCCAWENFLGVRIDATIWELRCRVTILSPAGADSREEWRQ